MTTANKFSRFHPRQSDRTRFRRPRAIVRALEQSVSGYVSPAVGKKNVTNHDPFNILIAAVLSARTRDTATEVAARQLFRRARTPKALLDLSEQEIAQLIRPVGMYPTKARWLRQIARILLERHRGQVPHTLEQLLALPGVGRKVANLVLGLAFHVPAICVDTHVHRISNRLGLVRTQRPEETEQALGRVLPRDLWIQWNDLLVTWGQNVCVPISPRCSQCVLYHRNLCPRVGVRTSR
ncbi:MAG: endonuclease III [Parcubacteria group bacterium Gr01-1014_106]|nr:MAG: endonuclease III [Parcubacteria group bacterium Gr01-1014_106]